MIVFSSADTTWSLVFQPPFDFPIDCFPCFLNSRVHLDAPCKRYYLMLIPQPLLIWFFLLQNCKNSLYYTVIYPTIKTLVDAIPIAVFFWKSPPFTPVFGYIQYCVYKIVVIDFYISYLRRKVFFDFLNCFFVIFMYLLYYFILFSVNSL